MPAVTIRLTGELRPGRGDGRRGAGSGFGRQRPSTPTVVSGWERLAAVRLRSAATAAPAVADAPSAPASSASPAPDGLPAMKCHTLRGQPWSPPPPRRIAARAKPRRGRALVRSHVVTTGATPTLPPPQTTKLLDTTRGGFPLSPLVREPGNRPPDHARPRRNPLPGHPVVAVRRAPVRSEADREGRRAGDLPEGVSGSGRRPATGNAKQRRRRRRRSDRTPARGTPAAVAPGRTAERIERVMTTTETELKIFGGTACRARAAPGAVRGARRVPAAALGRETGAGRRLSDPAPSRLRERVIVQRWPSSTQTATRDPGPPASVS